MSTSPKYKPYTLRNLGQVPQIQRLSEQQRFEIQVAARVFPFRTNNYVTEELIDWKDVPNDPVFGLSFPQERMLSPYHFEQVAALVGNGGDERQIRATANKIRFELNPHPAGQMECNRPSLEGKILPGMQHKYRETVLFFPSQGQTCHAYCTFCFRWPQFVGIDELKFAAREIGSLIHYVSQHADIADILFTGGDPLVMKTKTLASYIRPLLQANIPHLTTIRIGTKSLAQWPYRFLSDDDADELLDLFSRVTQSGRHLAIMAHFNHPHELKTDAVHQAIARIQKTGAQIRTQSPLLAHINDESKVWVEMWKEQVRLGCVPYYMFVARNTGAQHYFGVPLVQAWRIFRQAYQAVSGLARTVRGPVMSAHPGKLQVLGVSEINGEKVFVLRFLQGRDPDWVLRPFFAKYDSKAIWFDELKPAFGEEKFYFEQD
ncbi:MAG: lysine 2,3-aminomutase [Anaerolineae bacterium]|jgi:KamA family protein